MTFLDEMKTKGSLGEYKPHFLFEREDKINRLEFVNPPDGTMFTMKDKFMLLKYKAVCVFLLCHQMFVHGDQ